MAINLDDRYPGRANGKTLSYPQGSFKNRTSPTAKDGTYLEQDWANDQLAFFQSLMKDAGMNANGAVDTVEASQYFDALVSAVAKHLPVATSAEAQTLTNDAHALTPKKLAEAFSGANKSHASNGFQKLPGGLILQWGNIITVSAGLVTITYPVAFPNAVLAASGVANHAGNGAGFFMSLSSGGLAQATASIYSDTGTVAVGVSATWIAIGF